MTKQQALNLLQEKVIPCVSGEWEEAVRVAIEALSKPEIVRCKDCKFYTPINRETKSGICSLTLHQNFGDNCFYAGAERRTSG